MTDLDLADASVAGLLAFWSLVHVADDALPGALVGISITARLLWLLFISVWYPARRAAVGDWAQPAASAASRCSSALRFPVLEAARKTRTR